MTTFSNATFKEVIKHNSINNSLKPSFREQGLNNITLRVSKGGGFRRFCQSFLRNINSSVTILDTNIAIRQKKFKNKTILDVSNPQTDYKFYQKI